MLAAVAGAFVLRKPAVAVAVAVAEVVLDRLVVEAAPDKLAVAADTVVFLESSFRDLVLLLDIFGLAGTLAVKALGRLDLGLTTDTFAVIAESNLADLSMSAGPLSLDMTLLADQTNPAGSMSLGLRGQVVDIFVGRTNLVGPNILADLLNTMMRLDLPAHSGFGRLLNYLVDPLSVLGERFGFDPAGPVFAWFPQVPSRLSLTVTFDRLRLPVQPSVAYHFVAVRAALATYFANPPELAAGRLLVVSGMLQVAVPLVLVPEGWSTAATPLAIVRSLYSADLLDFP
ncbi:hypothetical protein BJV82DRAFT_586629 [Fennellomyces sp. T-0311]|nr:hypothetical protein BJV82DRAFT_586629 [Fennellomyces sp. T-0311]